MRWSPQANGTVREYNILLDIADPAVFARVFNGSLEDIIGTIEKLFVAKLGAAVKKELQRSVPGVVTQGARAGVDEGLLSLPLSNSRLYGEPL